jgi:hypothetical protein
MDKPSVSRVEWDCLSFDVTARVKLDGECHRNGRVDRLVPFDMHGVELVSVDLDAAARQFTLDRDRLEAALGKLLLQRLFSTVSEPAVDANPA